MVGSDIKGFLHFITDSDSKQTEQVYGNYSCARNKRENCKIRDGLLLKELLRLNGL